MQTGVARCVLLAEALLLDCELILSEGNFIADLHLVKKPFRITLQNLCEVDAEVTGGLAEAIHNAAQRRLMNAQHAGQTVLADAGGVHPQLQIRVNVSIQAHVFALGSMALQRPVGSEADCYCKPFSNLRAKASGLICQHIVDKFRPKISPKMFKLTKVLEV